MYGKLEKFLREKCKILEWNPTVEQLRAIDDDIRSRVESGEELSVRDCQSVVAKHCGSGSFKIFVTHGANNSDLNALLSMATKRDLIGD